MKKLKLNTYLIISLVLIGLSLTYSSYHQYCKFDVPFNYDEVDYINSSHRGIIENAFERNSLSFIEHLKFSYSKAKKSNYTLPEKYEEITDPFLLRHFHPPLPTYYWSVFDFIGDQVQQNIWLKISSIFLVFIILIILLFFHFKIIGYQNNKFTYLILMPILFLSNIFTFSFCTLNFHVFFLVFLLLLVFTVYRLNTRPERIVLNSIIIGLVLAGMFLCLETAIIFIACFVICALLLRFPIFKKVRIKYVLLSFVLALVILWPAIITNLTPLKSYSMYAYRILFQGNEEYSNVSMIEKWGDLFLQNKFIFLIILSSVPFYFLRKTELIHKMFFVTSVLYCLIMTPFMISFTYILPGIVLLFISSLLILNDYLNSIKYKILLIGVVTLLLIYSFINTDFNGEKSNALFQKEQLLSDFDYIKKLTLKYNRVYLDGSNIYSYYNPDTKNIRELTFLSYNNPELCERIKGKYVLLNKDVENGLYKVFIIKKNKPYTSKCIDEFKLWKAEEVTLNYYEVFIIP